MEDAWSVTETLDGSTSLYLNLDAGEMLFGANFLLKYFPNENQSATITMFDMDLYRSFQATMTMLSDSNKFVISWGPDFVNRVDYNSGDEILLRWDTERLCFKILQVSALRTYPGMSSYYRSYNNY